MNRHPTNAISCGIRVIATPIPAGRTIVITGPMPAPDDGSDPAGGEHGVRGAGHDRPGTPADQVPSDPARWAQRARDRIMRNHDPQEPGDPKRKQEQRPTSRRFLAVPLNPCTTRVCSLRRPAATTRIPNAASMTAALAFIEHLRSHRCDSRSIGGKRRATRPQTDLRTPGTDGKSLLRPAKYTSRAVDPRTGWQGRRLESREALRPSRGDDRSTRREKRERSAR